MQQKSFKNNDILAWTTWSLLANNVINIQVYRIFTCLEGLILVYYAFGLQNRIVELHSFSDKAYSLNANENVNQGSTPSNSKLFYLDLTFYDMLNIIFTTDQNYFILVSLVLFAVMIVILLGLVYLVKEDMKKNMKELPIQQGMKQIFGMFLTMFRSFLYLPALEFILRGLIAITKEQNLAQKIIEITIISFELFAYLILLIFTQKVFKLNLPCSLISWSCPNSKKDYIRVLAKLYLVIIYASDMNGRFIVIEIIGAIFLWISYSSLYCFYVHKFERSIDYINLFFNFFVVVILLQGLISYTFKDYKRQEIVLIFLFSIFVTLCWYFINKRRRINVLQLLKKEKKLKLENDYELLLISLINLVEESINQNKARQDYTIIISLLDQHSMICENVDCICHESHTYFDLMRECQAQQTSIFEVTHHQYKIFKNYFKKKVQKLICNTNSMSQELREQKLGEMTDDEKPFFSQKEKESEKSIVTFNIDLSQNKKTRSYRIEQENVKERFIANFILIFVQEIHSKFPKSQRILFLVNYYSMFVIKKPELCIAQMRNYDNMHISWLEKQSLKINQLYLLYQYDNNLKTMESQNSNLITFDGDHFIKLNQLYSKFHDCIETLTQNAIDLWKGFESEKLLIDQQQLRGKDIAIDILNLHQIFNDIDYEQNQKNYKLYYQFALVLLNVLNDNNGYNLHINKMKSLLTVNKLLKRTTNLKNVHEDTAFAIVDAFSTRYGKVLFMNKQLTTFLGVVDQLEMERLHINQLMPKLVGDKHDQFMETFNKTGQSSLLNTKIIQFIKRNNETIYPCEVLIKFHYSQQYNYTYLSVIRPMKELAPFKDNNLYLTNELLFISIDHETGQIYEVSKNVIKLVKILENEYAQTVKDLALNERAKTIEELLIDFNFQAYVNNKSIRAKKKENYEANHILSLSVFNDYQNMLDAQSSVYRDLLHVRVVLFDETYGNGSVNMSVVVMQILDRDPAFDQNRKDSDNIELMQYSEHLEQEQEESKFNDSSMCSQSSASGSSEIDNDMASFQTYSMMSTPRSLKIVIQLLFLLIVIATTIASVNLGLNINKIQITVSNLQTVKTAYDRINFTAANRLILRILINIANGYESNSHELIADRFTYYKEQQKIKIEQLRNTQVALDASPFKYSDEFLKFKDGNNLKISYLNQDLTVRTQFQTMQFAHNLFSTNLNQINNMTIEQLKGNLNLQTLIPNTDKYYKPTLEEQIIYFAIMNGNDVIRAYNWKFTDRYRNDTKQSDVQNKYNSEITSIISILTIVFVGLLISPTISKIQDRKYNAFSFFIKIPTDKVRSFITNCEKCLNLDDTQKIISFDDSPQDNFHLQKAILAKRQCDQFSKIESNLLKSEIYSGNDLEPEKNENKKSFGMLKNAFLNLIRRKLSANKLKAQQENDNFFTNPSQSKTPIEEVKEQEYQKYKIIQIQRMESLSHQEIQDSQIYNLNSKHSSQSVSNDNVDDNNINFQILAQQYQQQAIQQHKENSAVNKLNKQAFKAKICYVLFVMKLSILFSSYFVITYFMASHIFATTTNAIDSLDIIYFKDACIENLFVFIRENYIRNQSVLLFDDPTTIASDSLINTCFNKESLYRNMRKNIPVYFDDAKSYIELLETSDFCNQIYASPDQQDIRNKCNIAMNGLLKEGISNALFYMYAQQQKVNLDFKNAGKEKIRDFNFLYGQLTNQENIDIIDTKEYVLQSIFEKLKQACTDSTINYFKKLLDQYVIGYAIFIFLLVIAFVIFMVFGFKILRQTMWNTNLLLKMVPISALDKEEMTKLKQFFIN